MLRPKFERSLNERTIQHWAAERQETAMVGEFYERFSLDFFLLLRKKGLIPAENIIAKTLKNSQLDKQGVDILIARKDREGHFVLQYKDVKGRKTLLGTQIKPLEEAGFLSVGRSLASEERGKYYTPVFVPPPIFKKPSALVNNPENKQYLKKRAEEFLRELGFIDEHTEVDLTDEDFHFLKMQAEKLKEEK